MRRASDLEIIELYRRLQSAPNVSLKAGCSTDTVYNILRAAGEPIRKSGGGNAGLYKAYAISDQEICRRYREGQGMPSIALAAGTNDMQVRHILLRHGVQPRSQRAANRILAAKRKAKRLP